MTRPTRIPRYARFSPDTASDESSEEELPNFTLISADVILPPGAKRARATRLPPQQLILEEDVTRPPPPPSRRRTRNSLPTNGAAEELEGKRRGRPSRNSTSPEVTRTPRKFKRRRVLSDSEGDGSEAGEDDEEEEPVRPMPSRRSVRKASAVVLATKSKLPSESESEARRDLESRESSSDLSDPPESLMEVDNSEDESPVVRLKQDVAMADVSEVVEQFASTPQRRKRPAAVKIPQTSENFLEETARTKLPPVVSTIEIDTIESPDAVMFAGLDLMSPQKRDHEPEQTRAVIAKTITSQVLEPDKAHLEHATAETLVVKPAEFQEAASTAEKPTIEQSRATAVDADIGPTATTVASIGPSIPKKANSAAKRAPATKPSSVEKAKVTTKAPTTSILASLGKAKAAARSAPPSPMPYFSQEGAQFTASSSRTTSVPKASATQRRPRESTADLTSNLSSSSKPVRTHTRHRSMDIASLLNNEEPAAQRPFSPVYPPPLPLSHLDPIEPNRSFASTAPESFLRSQSGPPGRTFTAGSPTSGSFSPISTIGSQFSNAPLMPDNPKRPQKRMFDGVQRIGHAVEADAKSRGRSSPSLRSSSARTGPSDPTTAPSVLQSDVPSNALLSPASMNSLHHDSDSSELSELESDRDEVPQQMQTRSKTGHSKPKFLVQNTPSPGSPSNMPTEDMSPTLVVKLAVPQLQSTNTLPTPPASSQDAGSESHFYRPSLPSPNNVTTVAEDLTKTFTARKGKLFQFRKPGPVNVYMAPQVYQSNDGSWVLKDHIVVMKEYLPTRRGAKRAANVISDAASSVKNKRQKKTHSSEAFDIFGATPLAQQADGCWSEPFLEHLFSEHSISKRKEGRNAQRSSDLPIDHADADFNPMGRASTPDLTTGEDSPFTTPDITRRVERKPSKSRAPRRPAVTPYRVMDVQDNFPEPHGQPPAWGSKRQQLCESLPYYRAYQSGAYSEGGVVKGFMCDKEVGFHDKLTDEILISRVGGGKTFDPNSGRMIQTRDQSGSAFYLGFTRAMSVNQPVAVIIGKGNPLSPSKMPHYYNVADWFQVTDVWTELNSNVRVGYVRLEKISLGIKSWWSPKGSPDPAFAWQGPKATVKDCVKCLKSSKEIYRQGWTCLNKDCEHYFDEFADPSEHDALEYNEAFLKERTAYQGIRPPSLAPPVPTAFDMGRAGRTGHEQKCVKGIVCPQCQGCSRRIDWRRWTCEHGCGYRLELPLRTLSVPQAITHGIGLDKEMCDEAFGIRRSERILGLYDVIEYQIPGLVPADGPIGFIRHFRSSGTINSQPDGPNDLFRAMQTEDFNLKRQPARQERGIGEILTGHWATNWGAPYKYGVSQESRGFSEAPQVILKAVKRLTWAGAQALCKKVEPFQPFNELLSIAYMQNSAIGFHDDGEETLGPTVATLSLGCQAVMRFRPKSKVNIGSSNNAKGTKGDVLKLVLEHGDIVIMHGEKIQKLYDHAVKPYGMLRFALTCRNIKPESMKNDEDRADAMIKGAFPPGHERYNYDGDLNLQPSNALPGSAVEVTHIERLLQEVKAAVIAGNIPQHLVTEYYELFNRENRVVMNSRAVAAEASQDPPSCAGQETELSTTVGATTAELSSSTPPISSAVVDNDAVMLDAA